MRLLNVHTLELKQFYATTDANPDNPRPKYTILSHTWGEAEITFNDVTGAGLKNNPLLHGQALSKILGCCEQTKRDGYTHTWVDTCCIDKSSSAELSEAINSMFRWYREAEVCYAYLADTIDPSKVSHTRWLTRGWTLQELIAPEEVVFFTQDWHQFGTRTSLARELSAATHIDGECLVRPGTVFAYSVAERMAWAATRNTTRIEDEAYCLMGLFDVHMPLIYGEGRKAFKRLLFMIASEYDDPSVLFSHSPMPILDYEGEIRSVPASLWPSSPTNFQYLSSSPIQRALRRRGQLFSSKLRAVGRGIELETCVVRLIDVTKATIQTAHGENIASHHIEEFSVVPFPSILIALFPLMGVSFVGMALGDRVSLDGSHFFQRSYLQLEEGKRPQGLFFVKLPPRFERKLNSRRILLSDTEARYPSMRYEENPVPGFLMALNDKPPDMLFNTIRLLGLPSRYSLYHSDAVHVEKSFLKDTVSLEYRFHHDTNDRMCPILFLEQTQEGGIGHRDDLPILMVTATGTSSEAADRLLIFASTDDHVQRLSQDTYLYNNTWAISFNEVIMGAKRVHITLVPSLLHAWIEARRGTFVLKFHRGNNKDCELLARIVEENNKNGDGKEKGKESSVEARQGEFEQACFSECKDPMFSYIEKQGEEIIWGDGKGLSQIIEKRPFSRLAELLPTLLDDSGFV